MVSVVPLNDEREHVQDSWCWCDPRVNYRDEAGLEYPRGPIVVHEAADCRQVSERVTGETVSPSQRWAIVCG